MANTGQYDSQTNIELEDYEREIFVQPEAAVLYGGSVVNSVNGQTGHVTLTTSDLENTSDYQTATEVQSAIDTAVSGKQDILTAGNNISISGNTISAVDTTYTAGTGLDLSGTTFSADTTVLATKAELSSKQDKINDLPAIREGATAGATAVQPEDLAAVAMSGSYNDLTNKPTIPSKTSQLTNDSGFINSSYHDDTKQDIEDNSLDTTYKTIPAAINEVNSIAKGANQALSYANYSAMVTAFNNFASDKYNTGQNVMIVTLQVPDLWISGIESTSQPYTYTTDEAFTTALSANGYVQVGYYKLSALETQKVDLTDYVKNTDYATAEKGGTIRTSNASGLGISNGNLYAVTKAYDIYNSASNNMFIGKGTLENVITGKNLETSNNKVTSISSSSTNTEYPSAKAVYDYIQSLNGDEVNY